MDILSPEAALLAAVPDIISSHAPSGTIRFVSAAVRDILGREPAELVGRPFSDLVHPDDQATVRRQLEDLLTGVAAEGLIVWRALHHTGGLRWLEAHFQVVRDPLTSEPTELVAVTRNVTARLQAEQQRAGQRALLDTVFENSPSGKTLLRAVRDPQTGRIQDFAYVRRNRAARRIVGAPDDEDLTGHTTLIDHPSARENGVFARFEQVLETGKPWEGEQCVREGDQESWFYTTIARLDADQISVAFLNITAVKSAERRAAEVQAQLALSAEVAGLGFSVRDIRTGHFEVSDRFRQLYGLPAEGPVSFPALRELMNPEDQQLINAYDQAVAAGQEQRQRTRFRRADTGEERTMLGVSRVLHDATGQPAQVLATVIDITDVVRAEEQVAEARQQLSLAAEVAGLGLSVREIGSDQLELSPTLAAIYGFEPTRTQVSLAELYAISNPADVAAARADYEAAIRDGGTCQMQFRIRRPSDGAERMLLSRVRVAVGENKQPTRVWVAVLDITETARLAQRAAEANSALALVAEVAGLGLTDRPLDTEELRITPEYVRILGLPPTTTTLPLSKLMAFFDPHDIESRFQPYQQAVLRGEHPRPVRLSGHRADDGRPFTLLVAAGFLSASADMPARIQSVALDITDAVETERRAAEALAQLSLAAEVAGLGLSNRDLATGEVEMTAAYARLYGFPPTKTRIHIGELLSHSHPDDIRDVRPAFEFATAAIGATQQVQYRIYRADTGELRTLLTSARTVAGADGRPARLVAATLDITDLLRDRAEVEELRYWQRLTDQLPEILWVTDSAGNTLRINQRWFDLTGQSRTDFHENIWQRVLHPADAESANKSFQEAIRTGQSWEHELRLRGRDGTWRWYLSRAVPLRSGSVAQGPEGWVGLSLDIHERVRALAALRRANADLDTFVYAAAHDLKSPIDNLEGVLMAIFEEFSVRRRELPWEQDSLTAQLFDHANQAVARFRDTLADLAQVVDTQPLESGRPVPLDLATYVADLVLDMEAEFAAAQGLLCLDLRVPTLGSLPARHLRTLLFNLIGNALKYRQPGRAAHLWLRTRAVGAAWVELAVTDNGIGLDTQRATRAFELFGRLHPGAAGGTGIGLFIVRRVVEQAGGQIRVSGRIGEGTTFFIRLPRG